MIGSASGLGGQLTDGSKIGLFQIRVLHQKRTNQLPITANFAIQTTENTASITQTAALGHPRRRIIKSPMTSERRAAAAFRNLADHTCALELLVRFESRYSRLYRRALDRLYRIQEAQSAQPENAFVDERTHQMPENKEIAKKRTEPGPASPTPDQRLAVSVRQSFVDCPAEIPAKCAQAL